MRRAGRSCDKLIHLLRWIHFFFHVTCKFAEIFSPPLSFSLYLSRYDRARQLLSSRNNVQEILLISLRWPKEQKMYENRLVTWTRENLDESELNLAYIKRPKPDSHADHTEAILLWKPTGACLHACFQLFPISSTKSSLTLWGKGGGAREHEQIMLLWKPENTQGYLTPGASCVAK